MICLLGGRERVDVGGRKGDSSSSVEAYFSEKRGGVGEKVFFEGLEERGEREGLGEKG